MISDPNDITKMRGALDKFSDATQKLCDVRHSEHTLPNDAIAVQIGIDRTAAAKLALSELIPPEVP